MSVKRVLLFTARILIVSTVLIFSVNTAFAVELYQGSYSIDQINDAFDEPPYEVIFTYDLQQGEWEEPIWEISRDAGNEDIVVASISRTLILGDLSQAPFGRGYIRMGDIENGNGDMKIIVQGNTVNSCGSFQVDIDIYTEHWEISGDNGGTWGGIDIQEGSYDNNIYGVTFRDVRTDDILGEYSAINIEGFMGGDGQSNNPIHHCKFVDCWRAITIGGDEEDNRYLTIAENKFLNNGFCAIDYDNNNNIGFVTISKNDFVGNGSIQEPGSGVLIISATEYNCRINHNVFRDNNNRSVVVDAEAYMEFGHISKIINNLIMNTAGTAFTIDVQDQLEAADLPYIANNIFYNNDIAIQFPENFGLVDEKIKYNGFEFGINQEAIVGATIDEDDDNLGLDPQNPFYSRFILPGNPADLPGLAYHLQYNSMAINTGDPSSYDLDGIDGQGGGGDQPHRRGSRCDMGVFGGELVDSLFVILVDPYVVFYNGTIIEEDFFAPMAHYLIYGNITTLDGVSVEINEVYNGPNEWVFDPKIFFCEAGHDLPQLIPAKFNARGDFALEGTAEHPFNLERLDGSSEYFTVCSAFPNISANVSIRHCRGEFVGTLIEAGGQTEVNVSNCNIKHVLSPIRFVNLASDANISDVSIEHQEPCYESSIYIYDCIPGFPPAASINISSVDSRECFNGISIVNNQMPVFIEDCLFLGGGAGIWVDNSQFVHMKENYFTALSFGMYMQNGSACYARCDLNENDPYFDLEGPNDFCAWWNPLFLFSDFDVAKLSGDLTIASDHNDIYFQYNPIPLPTRYLVTIATIFNPFEENVYALGTYWGVLYDENNEPRDPNEPNEDDFSPADHVAWNPFSTTGNNVHFPQDLNENEIILAELEEIAATEDSLPQRAYELYVDLLYDLQGNVNAILVEAYMVRMAKKELIAWIIVESDLTDYAEDEEETPIQFRTYYQAIRCVIGEGDYDSARESIDDTFELAENAIDSLSLDRLDAELDWMEWLEDRGAMSLGTRDLEDRFFRKMQSIDREMMASVIPEINYPGDLEDNTLPKEFGISSIYPNPFNPTVIVPFSVPVVSDIRLAVYDILGREVVRLIDGKSEVGRHKVVWNGTDSNGMPVSSGIYLINMKAGDYSATRKAVLVK
ncbi:MAG: T9SS type A sorting domain-containing protein [Candidatus Electryonea clarkiae]|nr:T9SS type A sorting domain-containing protein [Candidatus Electryonea clarkiae]MDP8288720.1 T9SS type A sorting domain-containing protein [Candidatus Electryonea clarkiae]